MSYHLGAWRASAGLNGADRQSHIIRVAGAPQITLSRLELQVGGASIMSLQDRDLMALTRLMDASTVAGAKLAPSAVLDRLPATATVHSSAFLDSRPMTQTLFPAAR